MAKCFDLVGYIEPCNAVRQKYTGRALLLAGISSIGDSISTSATLSDNGLKVTQLGGETSFTTFIEQWKGGSAKALPIYINAENPFGVTMQGNTDSGRVMYTKTIPVSIPATRDGKAEEFIMGLQKGLHGGAAIVLETFGLDAVENENDIFGMHSPVRIDPASVTRNEYENGGAWTFNLVCEEPVPNVVSVLDDLSAALDTLNA